MARKQKIVTIELEGRDKDKKFLITEMPASQAERWAIRAFLALSHSGVDLPDDVLGMGMGGVVAQGLRSFVGLSWTEAEPLLEEVMTCIQALPDPNDERVTRHLVESDIEEPETRLYLKVEVLDLHTGFSTAGALWTSAMAKAA
jgi:hypothetical protein